MASEISGNKRFYGLLATDVRSYTMSVEGMSYIPWARAHAMAGRPAHEVLTFQGPNGPEPVRRLFGGTAVAVSVDAGGGKKQVSYLPVLNLKGRPVEDGKETSRDVGDAIGRCIARAIAMTHGLGLSLYSLCEGDGVSYVDALSIDPETQDIAAIQPLRDLKGKKDRDGKPVGRQTEYLGWHAAISACRITDPGFTWEVVEFPQADGSSFPATKLGGAGWMVAVKITYRGQEHVQWLPIMGVAMAKFSSGEKLMDHQPILEPDIMHWHQAVMRCLTKGIAIATGYGIALYAKGDVEEVDVGDDSAVQQAQASEQSAAKEQPERRASPQAEQQQGAAQANGAIADLRQKVKALLALTGSEETLFLGWLGVKSLAEASEEKLQRGVQALDQKLNNQKAARPN